ncbi:MAG: insulinase family protein [Campylobacteraceae bacterium]|nr:insulinase family protein [Campylobacteraceae bacterium]
MRKLVLFFFFIVLVFGLSLDENLSVGELDNGFKYYLYQNDTPKESVSMIMHIKAGSSDERDDEQGIAHFVEHMAFNGTEEFSKNELIKALESLGVQFGADLNAMTSFDETIYKLDIKKDDENIHKALKVMANMGFKVLFNADDLEAEKGVIQAEEKNRRNAYTRIMEQTLDYYYKDSIYAKRLPIGDMDIIRNATPELLKGFFNRYYRPNNASLVVVGDFDEAKMKEAINLHFGSLERGDVRHGDKSIGYFNELVVFNAHDAELTRNSVSLMFEGNSLKLDSYEAFKTRYKNLYISKLVSLLNDARKASGETKLSLMFYDMDIQNKKSLNTFHSSVIENDINASLSELSSLIKTVKQNGFSKSDFESAKKEFIAQNIASFEKRSKRHNPEIINEILSYISDGTAFLDPETAFSMNEKILNEITLDDVNAHFNAIVSSEGLIVGITTKDEFKLSKDEFKQIYENADEFSKELGDLPDSLLNETLPSVEPTKTEVDANLVYKFEFENGAEVWFKEINTDKDKVTFRAFKKGGFTNLADSVNATFAVNLANGSGIGEFNDYEVRKITAGEVFEFRKFIEKTSLGFSGSFMASDLENMLKAFYVEFENPKIDSEYFKRYQTIALDTLAKNETHPDYKFSKEFNDFYYNGSDKMRYASKDDILNMDKNALETSLKEMFSNAGEYKFIFVGDMNATAFIEVAKNYLGNLSGAKKESFIEDDGIRSLDKTHEFKRFYLSEDTSKNSIFIKNYDLAYTPKDAVTLELATEILNVLMREQIREKDGMVYGINAHSKLENLPYQKSNTNIYFTTGKENIETIIENVKSIIAYLKTEFNDEQELENAKLKAKVALEKSYQNPSFWERALSDSILFDRKFFNYDEISSLIDSVTMQDIKNVSKIAFDLEHFIVGSNIYEKAE